MNDTIWPYRCKCGCDERVGVYPQAVKRLDVKQGDVKDYVLGHHLRDPLYKDAAIKQMHTPEALAKMAHTKRTTSADYTVNPSTGCWEWNKRTTHDGYGLTSISGRGLYAHRVYYEQYRGPIPDGHEVDHLCVNPSCVNPNHLEPVTSLENSHRSRRSKLSVALVEQMKAEYAGGGVTFQQIASRHGLHKSTVRRAIRGETWPNRTSSPPRLKRS